MGVDVALFRAVVTRATSSAQKPRPQLVGVYVDSDGSFRDACACTDQPMLSRVKPYGSLRLSSQEMPQFIAELEVLPDDLARNFRRQVADLAERCLADAELELHLDGD